MRVGRIVKVKAQMKEKYLKLHANPWPEVTKAIHDCNIRNFSIYLKGDLLFSYFEYVGENYEKDMEILSKCTCHWLKETDDCQAPVAEAFDGELWSEMQEVFYQE